MFGHILWSAPSFAEACVVLNDIHLDIMDYIIPSTCSEGAVIIVYFYADFRLHLMFSTQFRSMWTEFEWENRVNVNSNTMSGDFVLSRID